MAIHHARRFVVTRIDEYHLATALANLL